ncbi:MAG: hypothetical protein H7Z38_05370 [Rubrivivax sp.]|nr:hypothetical protein [Pyrinomonadaceae bacterium]
MKKALSFLSATCLLLLIVAQAAAQTMPPPPGILVIVREDIKPGEMPAHDQEAAAYAQLLAKANERITNPDLRSGRIALTPIAGNENEVTYLWGYDSFDDMEKSNLEIDKMATDAKLLKADFDRLTDNKLHASQRDIIASLRPELSYGWGNVDVAQARYFVVTMTRIKPGHEAEYWDAFKKHVLTAREKTPLKGTASYAVYQVRAGMPGGFYISFRPLKSMAELDGASPMTVRNAMTDDGREKMDKVSSDAILTSETTFYRINPRISHVAPAMAARDTSPGFWNPKPLPAANASANGATRGRAGRRQ